jgi:hypothetical protein
MEKFLNGNPSFLISTARVSGNQSQNSPLTYGPDGGVSFKQRILGWLRENLDHVAKRVLFEMSPRLGYVEEDNVPLTEGKGHGGPRRNDSC